MAFEFIPYDKVSPEGDKYRRIKFGKPSDPDYLVLEDEAQKVRMREIESVSVAYRVMVNSLKRKGFLVTGTRDSSKLEDVTSYI